MANLIEFISAIAARTELEEFWRLHEIMATKEELLKKILEGPGLKPPPNVIPNLINPPTKQHINLLCQVTCLTLSSVFVLIRMYTKIYVMKNHGWEDGMHYRIIVLRHRRLTRDTVACLIAWVRNVLGNAIASKLAASNKLGVS